VWVCRARGNESVLFRVGVGDERVDHEVAVGEVYQSKLIEHDLRAGR